MSAESSSLTTTLANERNQRQMFQHDVSRFADLVNAFFDRALAKSEEMYLNSLMKTRDATEGLRAFVRGTIASGDQIVVDGLHRLIPGLSNPQLELLRRGLLELLTDVNVEKAKRDPYSGTD